MADWITPKTNWVASDKFNIGDYNRIVGNLLYLKGLAEQLFDAFTYANMVEEKNYYSMFYASEMNAIENNLNTLNIKTYSIDIGNKQTYSVNGSTPLYTEFNRIENAQELLFKNLYGQLSLLQHLAITCGGQKPFGKRCHYAKDEMIAHRLRFRLGIKNGGLL